MSGSFPIQQPADACAPHTSIPPPGEPEINIDGEAWAERGHPLERALELAVKHRILPAMPSAEDVARVLRDGGPDVDPFHHWFELIRLGGRAILFDTETSTFPNRHDELVLREFGRVGAGVFAPTSAVECWHQGSEASEGHHDVAFEHRGRWYHFVARDFSDWFDTATVTNAVNAAIADTGCRERFHRIKADSQGAFFILAEESRLAAFERDLRGGGRQPADCDFFSLPVEPPSVPICPASHPGAAGPIRFLDLACRLGKGQRILVADTADGLANRTLVPLLDAIARGERDLEVRLVAVEPGITDCGARDRISAAVEVVDVSRLPPERQVESVEAHLRHARGVVKKGENILLCVPWLTRVGSGRQAAGGMARQEVGWFQDFFRTGRNCGRGSLTLVVSIPMSPELPVDQTIFNELRSLANVEVWFSPKIRAADPCPAIDLARSCTQREEVLLTEREREGRRALRTRLRTLSPEDAARHLWEQLSLFSSNTEFLDALIAESDQSSVGLKGTEQAPARRSLWRRLFGWS